MGNDRNTVGSAIEDSYMASVGHRTGSAFNDHLLSQNSSQGGSYSPSHSGDGGGLVYLFLSVIFLFLLYIVYAGFVVSAELVTHHWLDFRYSQHNWYHVIAYAGLSITTVYLSSKLWGILPGLFISLIPLIPLYFSTQGNVGFWYIVQNGGEDLMDNTFSAWVALICTFILYFYVAIKTQRKKDRFIDKLINLRMILSIKGLIGVLLLLPVSVLAFYVIIMAISHH